MQLEMQENNANSKFKKGQEIKSGGHQKIALKMPEYYGLTRFVDPIRSGGNMLRV